jgi:[acyl-carrier-protein] S-malonyltransferase
MERSYRVGLLFAGQGAQKVGMGRDLWEAYPLVQEWYRRAEALTGFPLAQVSFEGPAEVLAQTALCQTALYVQGLALFWVLEKDCPWLSPAAAAGLSLGEWTAHAAAGSFDPEDGLRLVAQRGRWMEEAAAAHPGAMVAVLGLEGSEVQALARDFGLEVANYNAPGQTVLSGERSRIESLAACLQKKRGAKAVVLSVSGAFHSSAMKGVEQKLAEALAKTPVQAPRIPVFSNRTGGIVKEPSEIRQTLAEQVACPVLWESCLRGLLGLGIETLIELGPGGVLCGLLRRIAPEVRCFTCQSRKDLWEIAYATQR